MDYKLKIFLIIVCLLFIIYLYRKVATKKMEFKSAFSFFFIILLLMFLCIFDSILIPIKNFLGFEVVSNMIFFIGFVCVGLMLLSFGIKISIQEQKITKLTQEIAILKKDKKDEKNNRE